MPELFITRFHGNIGLLLLLFLLFLIVVVVMFIRAGLVTIIIFIIKRVFIGRMSMPTPMRMVGALAGKQKRVGN